MVAKDQRRSESARSRDSLHGIARALEKSLGEQYPLVDEPLERRTSILRSEAPNEGAPRHARVRGYPLESDDPLGISASDVRWDFTLSSANAAPFAQLYLRPRDMLKLGVLFHQGGEWQGRQVLSREWVERSTAPVTRIGDQEYGYYWWHQYLHVHTPAGHRRVDMLLASGNGGQKIYIVPELDLVAVFTGGNYNAVEDSPPNAIMARVLLPALLSRR